MKAIRYSLRRSTWLPCSPYIRQQLSESVKSYITDRSIESSRCETIRETIWDCIWVPRTLKLLESILSDDLPVRTYGGGKSDIS